MKKGMSAPGRCIGALLSLVCHVDVVAQPTYPSKPVRIIIPTTPGGSTDTLARLIGQKLSDAWGQPVLGDNRAGGNGVIAGDALLKSAPDGHTMMITSSAHIITPLLTPTPYNAVNDFTPIAGNATSETLLVVHPALPVKDLQGFIRLAKARPNELNYATGGVGTLSHLAGAWFDIVTGAKMQQIPYKSGAPAIVDLVAGQVQLYFAVPISIMPHVKSGRVRAISVTGKTRLSALPSVPTFAEAGLPGFDVKYWYGTLGPSGVPRDIVDRASTEIARILATNDVKDRLISQGMDPLIANPAELAALMKAETAMYLKIIETANIKLKN